MEFVQPLRSKVEIKDMKAELRTQSERNYILFMIGINAGLRVSDILSLKVRDVRGDHIKVIEQKTKKVKHIAINDSLKKALSHYIRNKQNNEYLIRSRVGKNKPISRSMAYKIIKAAADSCGISDIGTHTMRKTFGYHIYQKEKDVAALQKIYNHSDPKITLRYIGIEQDYQDAIVRNNNL
ncbi:site-specific integrase [Rummeliibacillus stabekisii]|uniref:Integrase n=1 Tax=Rummeliibacillus stabekisii TaxID=241244 RepID=A0A143HD30_9BACL|nr:site-specific integrase [Rummeliibacillus stabekisii]AMW99319.1 integrase [Rummeliibacillus stabekisii]